MATAKIAPRKHKNACTNCGKKCKVLFYTWPVEGPPNEQCLKCYRQWIEIYATP